QDNDSHCLTVVLDVDGSYSPLSGFGADISCVDLCMPFTPHIDNVEGAYYENGVYNFGFNVPVTFTASADFPEGGESLDISYHWDFGNGQTALGQNVVQSYFPPGTYTVTLTVNNAGCFAYDTITVNVTQEQDFRLFAQFNGHYN